MGLFWIGVLVGHRSRTKVILEIDDGPKKEKAGLLQVRFLAMDPTVLNREVDTSEGNCIEYGCSIRDRHGVCDVLGGCARDMSLHRGAG